MIFRRIKSHIEKENWFAVFVDFCIVVIGVLFAIQVANWNGDRIDRQTEARHLANLERDLRADIEEFQTVRDNKARIINILEINLVQGFGINAADLGASPSYDRSSFPDFGSQAWKDVSSEAFYTLTFDPSSQTFDMLISSGDIALIQDYELVHQLMAYQKAVDELEDFETNASRLYVSLVPTLMKHGYGMAHPFDIMTFVEAGKTDPGVSAAFISARNLARASYLRTTQTQAIAVETLSKLETVNP